MSRTLTFLCTILFTTANLLGDLSVSADFLYWYANETDLSYALKVTGVDTVPQLVVDAGYLQRRANAPVKYENFNAKWSPGFRAALGYEDPCRCWDVKLNYTYYRAKDTAHHTTDHFSVVPQVGEFGYINPWVNPGLAPTVTDTELAPFSPTQVFWLVDASWRFNFNQLDLEAGYSFECDCFTFRPYAGLRAASTDTYFNTYSISYMQVEELGHFHAYYDNDFTDRFQGVGLLAGFQPSWHLSDCLAFTANISGALLWGEYRNRTVQNYQGTGDLETLSPTVEGVNAFSYWTVPSNNSYGMQPVIDLALGFNWEECWSDCFTTEFFIGWEHHIWFNHTKRNKQVCRTTSVDFEADDTPLLDTFTGSILESHDIGFGGLVVRASVGF